MLFKAQIDRSQPQFFIPTEVERNTPWRQVYSATHMVHQQRHKPSGKNKLERVSKLVRLESREEIDNGLYDRFG